MRLQWLSLINTESALGHNKGIQLDHMHNAFSENDATRHDPHTAVKDHQQRCHDKTMPDCTVLCRPTTSVTVVR